MLTGFLTKENTWRSIYLTQQLSQLCHMLLRMSINQSINQQLTRRLNELNLITCKIRLTLYRNTIIRKQTQQCKYQ